MDGNWFSQVRRYARIWRRAVVANFSILAASRLDFLMFVPGKLLRMGFFVVMPLALLEFSPTIVGYSGGEVLVFFALMNTIDVITQIFFLRALNLMPYLVRTGDFDFVLTKPIKPLLWTMFRIMDIFDVLTAPGAIAYLWFAWASLETQPALGAVLLWLAMTAVAIVLAFAIVLSIVALTLWTTETDNVHFLYRDALNVSRFPPEVFPQWARLMLTSIIPTFVIVSVPAKALLGQLAPGAILGALVVTVTWLALALLAWRAGIRHYSSASS